MYEWTDASALWQARNGEPGTARTESAWSYIEDRLDDYSAVEANAMSRQNETRDEKE